MSDANDMAVSLGKKVLTDDEKDRSHRGDGECG